ncbi:MAG: NYN domain-containing protein [Nitrospirae bacterium]|nr:NYN domain-containing protein [Nitrospirota bacterium]
MEAQRQKLIGKLSVYKKQKAHDITVVFDGWKRGSHTETLYIDSGIRVVYSRLGEKADIVIKRLLEDKRHYIVISSDRDIQSYAWSHDSVPVDSEEFLRIIEGETEKTSNENTERRYKGNPLMLSKKLKAQRKAINKL